MTEVSIKISGAVASASKTGPLVAGMVGVPVAFSFDDSWGGLNITAVFSGSGEKIDCPLVTERTTEIPWEVMTKPNTQLQIGAEGRLPDGTLVIPTVWATVGTLRAGARSTGNLAQPPSPTPYDRIMAAIGDLSQLSTEAKDNLVAAINEVINSVASPEQITAALEAYLAANPIEETDPTVPAWAKQPTKPTYTAREVGALPSDTELPVVPTNVSAFENDSGYLTEHQDLSGYAKTEEIPKVPSTLPNPHPLTLTGAVSATYDGSEAVAVEIPKGVGRLTEVFNVTLTEDAESITIDKDNDGNPLALDSFWLYIFVPDATTAAQRIRVFINDQNDCMLNIAPTSAGLLEGWLHLEKMGNGIYTCAEGFQRNNYYNAFNGFRPYGRLFSSCNTAQEAVDGVVESIKIGGTVTYLAESVIRIYSE